MKAKYLALPLAVLLILSACGQDNDDINDAGHNEIQDPLLQDGGENDIGN